VNFSIFDLSQFLRLVRIIFTAYHCFGKFTLLFEISGNILLEKVPFLGK
jgi:hypothetical protein